MLVDWGLKQKSAVASHRELHASDFLRHGKEDGLRGEFTRNLRLINQKRDRDMYLIRSNDRQGVYSVRKKAVLDRDRSNVMQRARYSVDYKCSSDAGKISRYR